MRGLRYTVATGDPAGVRHRRHHGSEAASLASERECKLIDHVNPGTVLTTASAAVVAIGALLLQAASGGDDCGVSFNAATMVVVSGIVSALAGVIVYQSKQNEHLMREQVALVKEQLIEREDRIEERDSEIKAKEQIIFQLFGGLDRLSAAAEVSADTIAKELPRRAGPRR